MANINRSNTKDFIQRANEIHKNRYNYSEVDYKSSKTKVTIICPIHGKFEQTPHNHLHGGNCPNCIEYKGEEMIMRYLIYHNIDFIRNKTFDDCKDKNKLKFDFYLKDLQTCIEFDGRQHFEICNYYNGETGFVDRQKKDKIKTDYCNNNNIILIRIRYDEVIDFEDIIDILDEALGYNTY